LWRCPEEPARRRRARRARRLRPRQPKLYLSLLRTNLLRNQNLHPSLSLSPHQWRKRLLLSLSLSLSVNPSQMLLQRHLLRIWPQLSPSPSLKQLQKRRKKRHQRLPSRWHLRRLLLSQFPKKQQQKLLKKPPLSRNPPLSQRVLQKKHLLWLRNRLRRRLLRKFLRLSLLLQWIRLQLRKLLSLSLLSRSR
jgi:hypothetical protein